MILNGKKDLNSPFFLLCLKTLPANTYWELQGKKLLT